MARRLSKLRIDEVSSVDRGAGEGVKIMLMKRDFSASERRRDAKSGAAMRGGSFPIENKSDLKNAIRLAGNAKNPEAARRHIISRARALGASDMIPDTWSGGKTEKVMDGEYATALEALRESLVSIVKSDDRDGAEEALDETLAQFDEHVAALAASHVAKGATMSDDLKKKLEDAEAIIAKKAEEIAFLKLSEKHREFVAKGSDDEKKAWVSKTDAERDTEIEKAAIAKRDAIPDEVKKQLAKAEENERILKSLQEKDELATFGKRAVDIGLREADAATLRKAYQGDKESLDKLCTIVKGLYEQVRTGKVFAEAGMATSGAAGSAYDMIVAKAADVRKADSKLTIDQAFEKAYTDPANVELVKQYKSEEQARMRGVL